MRKIILLYGFLILCIYLFSCVITPFSEILRKRSIENQINYLDNIIAQGYDDIEMVKEYENGSEMDIDSGRLFLVMVLWRQL